MESTKGMKLQYICAYWANGGWSTSGVKLSKVIFNETTNRTQVICESEHLTSFVVLVSVTDEAVSFAKLLKYILHDNKHERGIAGNCI